MPRQSLPLASLQLMTADNISSKDKAASRLSKKWRQCLPTGQSSGAVWKSRWPSWAPVPNKPTVSVDVKQHSTNPQANFQLIPDGSISSKGQSANIYQKTTKSASGQFTTGDSRQCISVDGQVAYIYEKTENGLLPDNLFRTGSHQLPTERRQSLLLASLQLVTAGDISSKSQAFCRISMRLQQFHVAPAR